MTGSAEDQARVFARSWGAEITRPGEVRFRIWAPGQDELAILIDGVSRAMRRDPEGWFELHAEGVSAGSAYQYLLADGMAVPDPASRLQGGDVHGPSVVVDPARYRWRNNGWTGRPWEEAVIYELHLGTFTEEGTFRAASERLASLAELGITAIELMPVAQFSGNRGWGYDGVLLYAPHPAYGTPDDMKAFIDAAHDHGLMVLLDVVYNHFGPDGNYLNAYAPDFFHPERHTPWGAAIAYERQPVRDFFIENALYWLEEFQLDGLRFDAIDNIVDESSDPELMVEIARRIRSRFPDRHIHLTTEDNRNITRLHERGADGEVVLHTGEWNDDMHNVLHVIATGEVDGYYADFADDVWAKLGRALAEGFAYQGDVSPHVGKARGTPSAHLPPTAFIDFLQNHDQTGNRALGERLTRLADPRTLELMSAMLLLSPHIPLLFMGEEHGDEQPFFFFTDFQGDLARAVRDGRRREFASFASFAGSEEEIPDPNDPQTFMSSRPDWSTGSTDTGRRFLARTRQLLSLRHERIVPLLRQAAPAAGKVLMAEDGAVAVDWRFGSATLSLRVNLSDQERTLPAAPGEVIWADPPVGSDTDARGRSSRASILLTVSETS
ncbi:malto-oligosyltrehalose trehalohydrolase [Chelativorans sp. ZYF759]|uniref:malto-oligosyltrehalose trehalohydrolase n=1 Tax=Chelativorans sp. ZYF759 TaxID=2692213 RepID=UPI00145CAE5B|nr:malto-oligosyltrehalose trehalohydrolase [Chelativorans sp. ZYF759]NMG37833.1 malto-oligosyltrehalose trehalohydrolase [Chelativorans sp. ZYF759]